MGSVAESHQAMLLVDYRCTQHVKCPTLEADLLKNTQPRARPLAQ